MFSKWRDFEAFVPSLLSRLPAAKEIQMHRHTRRVRFPRQMRASRPERALEDLSLDVRGRIALTGDRGQLPEQAQRVFPEVRRRLVAVY